MSTKEMAYSCIDCMTERQMLEFIRDQIGLDDIPNQETLEALAELKYMKAHPEEYKRYVSVEAMMNDILGEEDDD
jgi:transcription antitermination factor NusG